MYINICLDFKSIHTGAHLQIKNIIWVFPKIGVPPNHPLKNRVFHEKNHPFWGTPITYYMISYIHIILYRLQYHPRLHFPPRYPSHPGGADPSSRATVGNISHQTGSWENQRLKRTVFSLGDMWLLGFWRRVVYLKNIVVWLGFKFRVVKKW